MNTLLLILVITLLIIYNLLKSLVLLLIPRSLRNKKSIAGNRVLITGAGNGLGRELAIEFSKHAVCLVLVDIDRPSLLETEKLLSRCSTAFIYDFDISDYKKVYEMAKIIRNEAGDIDILVNNAGIMSRKYVLEIEEEKVMKTMAVNVLAHIWLCKAFLPAMMVKNAGHIVNIASMVSKLGLPGMSEYCATKYAAVGFAESLCVELKTKKLDGIKVTVVNPSHMNTRMFSGLKMPPILFGIGQLLSPQYVAQEVVTSVLLEEEELYLPHYFKYVAVLLDVLPRWLSMQVVELTGTIKAFEDFKGVTKSENGTISKSKKT